VVLEADPSRARDIARKRMAHYFSLPNYLNNWRCGFDDADITAPGSDRLIDALVAWGDEHAIAERVRQHRLAPGRAGAVDTWQEAKCRHYISPGEPLQRRVVAAKTRAGHHSRIERVDRHPLSAVFQPAVQFLGEQQIAQFRGGVAAPALLGGQLAGRAGQVGGR
jgi:hypothetical protein